jgi:hypothetical protein
MFNTSAYNCGVLSGTRNHKGSFVQEVAYKLIGINQAGWALICQDEMTCHYIDPENLVELEAIEAESEAGSEAEIPSLVEV